MKKLLVNFAILTMCILAFVSCDSQETNRGEVNHSHSFSEWKTTLSPTCTEKGKMERSCACGENQSREVEALDHTIVSEAAKAPTCTEVGWEDYTVCYRCGYTTNYVEKPALGHDEITHEEKDPTCIEIGWEAYVACSRCDYSTCVEKPALGHDEVTHEAKAPTCTEIGWNTFITCARCDYSTYAEKSALGHTAGDDATCTTEQACVVCHVVLTDALGHDEITHEAKDPTCIEIGWEAYVACSRCDYSTCVEKTALGHDEITHEAKDPTCTELGWDAYVTCSRCDYATYSEKSALGHDESYISDENGHWAECLKCDFVSDSREHTLDEDGFCTVCDRGVVPTEGIMYKVSSNGAYATVRFYTGSNERVIIASEYEGVPVTHIDSAAFEGSSIKAIYIPDSVIHIGDQAFRHCYNLEGVVIPDSVTSIGKQAFNYCNSLRSVTIGNGVTSIGIGAFSRCRYIDSISIGNSVTRIDSSAFSNTVCGDVYISDIESWCNINFDSYDANPLDSCSNLYLNGELVTDLVIPDSVSVIRAWAFYRFKSLESVVIPNARICDFAFSDCESLTNVILGDGVESIDRRSFANCFSLERIVIPGSVKRVEEEAFLNVSLETVYYTGTKEQWLDISFDNGNSKLYTANVVYNYNPQS